MISMTNYCGMMLFVFALTLFSCNSYALSTQSFKRQLLESTKLKEAPITMSLSTSPYFSHHLSSSFMKPSATVNYLDAAHLKGRELLEKMKPPQMKDEAWRHTNTKSLFIVPSDGSFQAVTKDDISPYIAEKCVKSHLVFVDGSFAPELSDTSAIPASVVVGSYINLMSKVDGKTTLTDVESSLLHVPDIEEQPRNSFGSDILTAINMIGMIDVAVIKVPAQTVVDIPVQVIFYSSFGDSGNKASYPRLYVDVAQDSRLDLLQSYISGDSGGRVNKELKKRTPGEELKIEFQGDANTDFTKLEENENEEDSEVSTNIPTIGALVSSHTHVLVADNAVVRHSYSQELPLQYARHTEVVFSELKSNASYTFTSLQMGCLNSRLNVHSHILGADTNCTINGVILCEEKQFSDIHSSIVHDTPSAKSRQQQRIVVSPKSQAVFKGRIRIPKHAQESDSDQLCRSVMLGERARVIAMPTLEITADNVVCSHGASVTDLDPNSMFYLKSRGISGVLARKMLLKGFVMEVLIGDGQLQESRLHKRALEKIERMSPDRDVGSGQGYLSM